MDNKPTLAEYIARQAGVPGASCPNLPNTYIGMRYVPEFADPVEWDETKQTEYEYLKIVTYQGNSYTSRTWVPKNIPITNTDYWILTGNYNAQVEAYRKEVQEFDGRITAVENEYDQLEPMVRNNSISINELFNQVDGLTKYIKNKKILILGDSIADPDIQWSSTVNYTWPLEFQKLVAPYGATVVNLSLSSRGYVYKAGTPLLNNSDVIRSTDLSDIDTIILCGGINDFLQNVKTGDYGNMTYDSDLWSNLNAISIYISTAKKNVFVMTPLPTTAIGNSQFPYTPETFRRVLAAWAFKNGYLLINGSRAGNLYGNIAARTSDGLHVLNEYTPPIAEYVFKKIISGGEPYQEMMEVCEQKTWDAENIVISSVTAWTFRGMQYYHIRGTTSGGNITISLPNIFLDYTYRPVWTVGNNIGKAIVYDNQVGIYPEDTGYSGDIQVLISAVSRSLDNFQYYRHE